jgi:hypothetical protein
VRSWRLTHFLVPTKPTLASAKAGREAFRKRGGQIAVSSASTVIEVGALGRALNAWTFCCRLFEMSALSTLISVKTFITRRFRTF